MIIAHYQHGMTYREIAAHLTCSVASVQWWINRGLKHLAELVGPEFDVDNPEGRRGA